MTAVSTRGRGASAAGDAPLPGTRAPYAAWAQGRREAIVAFIVGGWLIAVLAMWWADTPSLHGWADELTAAGRLLGLAGGYLLLVEVLLMARVPWLDAVVGMDRLAVWHRRNGEYVVALLVGHTVAITAGYALSDHQSFAWETGSLITHYPDVLAAFVALAILVGIGITSARAVRRRLEYHTWYFIHLYAYLALVLGFAHQLATGNELATSFANRALWVGLNVFVAAMLIIYRVAVPIRGLLHYDLRVQKVELETHDTVSVWVTGRHLSSLRVEPGQFFLWRFLTRNGWWQAHPFSISARPDGKRLRITVKALGDHTRWMAGVHKGTRVMAEGPYGAFTPARRLRRKVLFVGGGIGVTPLRAMFEAIDASPGDLSFIHRATTESDFALRDELERIAQRRKARVAFVAGGRDDDPLDVATLQSMVPDLAAHDVFVAGPPGFVDHAVDLLVAAGAERRHVFTERFEL